MFTSLIGEFVLGYYGSDGVVVSRNLITVNGVVGFSLSNISSFFGVAYNYITLPTIRATARVCNEITRLVDQYPVIVYFIVGVYVVYVLTLLVRAIVIREEDQTTFDIAGGIGTFYPLAALAFYYTIPDVIRAIVSGGSTPDSSTEISGETSGSSTLVARLEYFERVYTSDITLNRIREAITDFFGEVIIRLCIYYVYALLDVLSALFVATVLFATVSLIVSIASIVISTVTPVSRTTTNRYALSVVGFLVVLYEFIFVVAGLVIVLVGPLAVVSVIAVTIANVPNTLVGFIIGGAIIAGFIPVALLIFFIVRRFYSDNRQY